MHLQTEHFLVRPLLDTDADALYGVLSDPEVMRYIQAPFSREQTAGFISACGQCEPPLIYAVEDEHGALAGQVIFHSYHGGYEIGWVLGRPYWGRGAATELTGALIGRARELGVPVLFLECVPEHGASRAIAEKFGFTACGAADGCLVYSLSL